MPALQIVAKLAAIGSVTAGLAYWSRRRRHRKAAAASTGGAAVPAPATGSS
jgi:hypothetical protein